METISDREVAITTLLEIMEEKGYNNIVLRKSLNKNKHLSNIQKNFVTEIVNGVLRNITLIDYIINTVSNTTTNKMKPFILVVLRVSVYQIRFMDKVPDSAVTNEAVNLVKKYKYFNLSAFVNGVLRNIIRAKDTIEFPDEQKENVKYLRVMYSYPDWLVKKFLEYYDNDYEKVKSIFIINNTQPKISICVNTLKISCDNLISVLEAENVKVEKSKIGIENALQIWGTSDLSKLESFKNGFYHIMDESAMLAVLAADISPNDKVIDVCAAPGGKSFFASYLMKNKGEIYSRDIFEHKIGLIESTANRLDINIIKSSLADATNFYDELEGRFDKVIVDAPCSGLGLVRKKPDIKFSKTKEDLVGLVELQREILAASWKYTKVGGNLIYSTCTLTKEENINNVMWFLDNFPFELESFESSLPSSIKFNQLGILNISPDDFETDGFFIAKLKRK